MSGLIPNEVGEQADGAELLKPTFNQQAWGWHCITATAAKPVRVPSRGWLKVKNPPAIDHIVVVPADMPCLKILPELLGC